MNVFDFDKTIFRSDSTAEFIKFMMKRHPKALLYLPRIGAAAFGYYALHIGTKTRFKERMYTLFKACDAEREAELFWDENIGGVKAFYMDMRRDDDVIISASPEFLLKPVAEKLGFTVIASRVSPKDGKTAGENCYHEEKVRRFRERFGDAEIDGFYSDSYSDEPLAKLAKKAFIVDGDRIVPWDFSKHKKNLRT